jgi:RND superfamily putative drug exporter
VFARLGRFSVRFRWFIVAFWLVATVLGVHYLPSLSSVANNQNSAFLPADAPSNVAAGLATPFERSNLATGVIVAATTDHSPLSAADNAAMTRVEAAAARLSQVKGVRDQGFSSDDEARKALVETSAGGFDQNGSKAVVGDVRALFTGLPANLTMHFTGELPTAVDESASTQQQQKHTEQLSIVFIILLLLIVFRGVLAPLVTLFPAVLAFSIAGPIIAEAAKAGAEVSGFTQFMLIVLMLGAGTDYGLFLIFRVREEMARGAEPRQAVEVALARVGESVTFSASTVILAFLSLIFASFGLYRGLGPGLAIGIAVVLVVDLTLLPALLSILGKAVFWPRIPAPHSYREGLWGRAAGRVVAKPALTLVLGTVVFGGLAFANIAYSASGFGSTSGAPDGSDAAIGQAVLEHHFPLADVNPTNILFRLPAPVWDDPSLLTRATTELSAAPIFKAVAGPLDPNGAVLTAARLASLHSTLGPAALLPAEPPANLAISLSTYETYRATAQFVSTDGRTLQFYAQLTAGDPGGDPAMHAVPQIRATTGAVAASIGATKSGVAGEASAFYDVATISGQDLVKIIPIVLFAILLLLILLLRSLIAPLYLILSVGLSYLAALGLACLAWIVIAGDSGINFILPFFMFIFLMALGEDYNILVMSRIREEAHDRPLAEAVRVAVGSTGTTVTSAGLILAGTFVVLTIATTGSIRQVGIGLAVGVLLDTFLVRTLIVPSVVVLLGRWNWWPSHLYRRGSGLAGDAGGTEAGELPPAAKLVTP